MKFRITLVVLFLFVLGYTYLHADNPVGGNLPRATTNYPGVVQLDGTSVIVGPTGIIGLANPLSVLNSNITDVGYAILASNSVTGFAVYMSNGIIYGNGQFTNINISGGLLQVNGTNATTGQVLTAGAGGLVSFAASASGSGTVTLLNADAASVVSWATATTTPTPTFAKTSSSQFGVSEVDNATLQAVSGVISVKTVPLANLANGNAYSVIGNNASGSAANTSTTSPNLIGPVTVQGAGVFNGIYVTNGITNNMFPTAASGGFSSTNWGTTTNSYDYWWTNTIGYNLVNPSVTNFFFTNQGTTLGSYTVTYYLHASCRTNAALAWYDHAEMYSITNATGATGTGIATGVNYVAGTKPVGISANLDGNSGNGTPGFGAYALGNATNVMSFVVHVIVAWP